MRDPDGLLARAGISPDTDRDQHFLVDDRVLDRLPGYLSLPENKNGGDSDDRNDDLTDAHLLEVGAGTGALTDRLLTRFERVTAVERDADLATFLREEFVSEVESGRLRVIEGDATAVDLPTFDASVSNLPYGVSSTVLFRLLPRKRPLVVMVQREFAERMAAAPCEDEYGRLSVTAGHYADVEVVEPVPPTAFEPAPAVDSAVVRTVPRTPAYEVPRKDFFLDFVTAVFTQRRKTMRNAVRNTVHISGLTDPEAVVDAADEDLMSRRAGTVTPSEFAELANLAAEVGALER